MPITYVYAIIVVDDAVPLYVGKGSNDRVKRHVPMAVAGTHKNKRLQEAIRRALAVGKTVVPQILYECSSHEEAYDLERRVISALKRLEDGGPLLNLTGGGTGGSSVWSQESKDAQSERKLAMRDVISAQMKTVWAERDLDERMRRSASMRHNIDANSRKRGAETQRNLPDAVKSSRIRAQKEAHSKVDWVNVNKRAAKTRADWSEERKAAYSAKMKEAAAKRWGNKKCPE